MAPYLSLVFSLVLAGAPSAEAAIDCEVVTKSVFECGAQMDCPPSKPFGQGNPNCQVSPTCNPDIVFNVLSGTSVNPKSVQILSSPYSPSDNEIRCSWTCCDTDVNGKSVSQSGTSANTGTRTHSATQTQIHTQIHTQTLVQTSSVSRLSTSTGGEADESEQGQFLENQRRMLEQAGRKGLTNGMTDCLDAANTLVGPSAGGETADQKLERCQRELADGGRMVKDAAKRKGGLSGGLADEDLLKEERSQAIFARFEKLFGQPGEELVRRMLASGADLGELRDALGAKLGDEKANEWLKDADDLKFVVDVTRKRGGAPAKKPGLRADLKKALENSREDYSQVAAAKDPQKDARKVITPEDLTPLREDPLFSGEQELSLFEVVSRKYREKWGMLVPYRAAR